MDGDTNETVQSPAEDSPSGKVSPEQLVDYLLKASFQTTLGKRGYQQWDVDAFLTRLVEATQAGEPLADLVRRTQFTPVRLEDGYDPTQVDDFLAAVVDLDPHADPARPEVARSGLIAKLFG